MIEGLQQTLCDRGVTTDPVWYDMLAAFQQFKRMSQRMSQLNFFLTQSQSPRAIYEPMLYVTSRNVQGNAQ